MTRLDQMLATNQPPKLIRENLKKAKVQLRLELPIRVTVCKMSGGYRGKHYLVFNPQKDRWEHNIRVADILSSEGATKTLWHELAHCKQAEGFIAAGNDPADFNKFYRSEDGLGMASYHLNKMEIEARELAESEADKLWLFS